jgi:hypothetical protein
LGAPKTTQYRLETLTPVNREIQPFTNNIYIYSVSRKLTRNDIILKSFGKMILFCKDSLLGIMVVEKSLFINHDFNAITILNNDFAADFHNFNGDDGLIFYYASF